MRKFVRTPRGLTLIEMMGAMVVSTILLSSAWQLLQGGMQSYQRGLQDVRMTQEARALLRLVTRDVQRAMAARVPYGIRGAAPQSPTAATGEGPADRLAMLTIPPLAAPGEGVQHSGEAQRIRYVLSALPESKTFALQRAELPRAVEITLVIQSGGAQARVSRFATLVTAD